MLTRNPGLEGALDSVTSRDPLEFHRRLPGYRPTPLVELPEVAARLGIARLWVKDESARFDLQSFKVLGGSWAVYRELSDLLPAGFSAWERPVDLAAQLAGLRPLELITATEGNHGRGVARTAAWFGLGARIFIRRGAEEHRVAAMEREGATVEFVDGTYDDACDEAMRRRGPRALLIQDTSRPGYEQVPLRVIEGYATLGVEIDGQLAECGETTPDLVLVQIGVGALAAAIVRHFRAAGRGGETRVVGVEPHDAACAAASLAQGRPTVVPGPHRTRMSGMRCGVLAGVAWPWLSRGLSGVVTVDDEESETAMRTLDACGIAAGESGAAGLAGLEALKGAGPDEREALALGPRSRVLVICTEGPTDPVNWRRVVGDSGPQPGSGGVPGEGWLR